MKKDPRTKITMSQVGEYLSKKTKTKINYSMLSYLDERPKSPEWTDKEVEILRQLKSLCLPTELVSHIMKRSYAAIKTKMHSSRFNNKIKSTYLPRWTKKETKILVDGKAKGLSNKYISLEIGRTVMAVGAKWDMYRKKHDIATRPFWTDKEVDILKKCRAGGMTFKKCALKLGRKENTVKFKWYSIIK